MKQLHDLMNDVLINGQERDTRSGKVTGVFRRDFQHDMREGLPFPMTKKLMFKAMMGELLFFLNGKVTISELRRLSGLSDDAWTIWTQDQERWYNAVSDKPELSDSLGVSYGEQWRNYGSYQSEFKGVDQIANLIGNMINSKTSRYLIVQAYDPIVVANNLTALPPCHTGFQVYIDVETGEFDLDWTQRSVDIFLGAPFNIASYAVLMLILGKLTGYTPRFLFGSLKDVHIYKNHYEAVNTQLLREVRECTASLEMPEFNTLDDLLDLTAEDFVLHNYFPDSAIKAPLSVG